MGKTKETCAHYKRKFAASENCGFVVILLYFRVKKSHNRQQAQTFSERQSETPRQFFFIIWKRIFNFLNEDVKCSLLIYCIDCPIYAHVLGTCMWPLFQVWILLEINFFSSSSTSSQEQDSITTILELLSLKHLIGTTNQKKHVVIYGTVLTQLRQHYRQQENHGMSDRFNRSHD